MRISYAIKLVKEEIESHGYKVIPAKEYFCDPGQMIVGYVDRSHDDKKLISLLHEYGHAVQDMSSLGNKSTKNRNKAFIVAQEYTAWIEGKRLANKLGFLGTVITEEEYDDEFARCWVSYFDMVSFEHYSEIKQLAKIYKSKN